MEERWWSHAAAAALLLIFLLQVWFASGLKSPAFDEPPHLASGLSYIETGRFNANPQHPPLLKELSGLSLWLGGIRMPKSKDAQSVIDGTRRSEQPEWMVGFDVIASNGPDRVMRLARAPFIVLGVVVGALIYLWGRTLVGTPAALGALFLYALDPTMIGHAFLVTTDVGMTAFALLFLAALWRYLQQPTRPRTLLCGIALGLALGAKFTAVFLGPMALVLIAVSVWLQHGASPVRRASSTAPNSPCTCGSGKKYKRCHGAAAPVAASSGVSTQTLLTHARGFIVMCIAAYVVVQALYFFPSNFLTYWNGMQQVNADHGTDFQAYLHGDMAMHFYSYFVVAWLVKEPVAIIALAVAGFVWLMRTRAVDRTRKWFLLLPPAVFVLVVTVFADNLGIRYIFPALPFVYLLGGAALVRALTASAMWMKAAAGAACLWLAVAAAGIYPDHLSYFNEAACVIEAPQHIGLDGGSRCGPLWLDDSNVDWGLGLKQLSTWMEQHAPGRRVNIAYFGSLPPSTYKLPIDIARIDSLGGEPPPGLYAVSAHILARVPMQVSMDPAAFWMRRLKPIAVVGHAYYIYDIPGEAR